MEIVFLIAFIILFSSPFLAKLWVNFFSPWVGISLRRWLIVVIPTHALIIGLILTFIYSIPHMGEAIKMFSWFVSLIIALGAGISFIKFKNLVSGIDAEVLSEER